MGNPLMISDTLMALAVFALSWFIVWWVIGP